MWRAISMSVKEGWKEEKKDERGTDTRRASLEAIEEGKKRRSGGRRRKDEERTSYAVVNANERDVV
jgi:hypothetical protein